MGSLIGLYLPLNYLARNGDCFSETWYSVETLLEYHTYFDGGELPTDATGKELILNLILFSLSALSDALSIASGLKVCVQQFKDEKDTNWLDLYVPLE